MIVIVIIGVVYTLAVTKLQSVGENKMTPSLGNLKEFLTNLNEDKEGVRLLCLDDCSSCDIYKSDEKVGNIENFVDDSIEVYRYDFLQGAMKAQETVFFNEENVQESVCFSFGIDKNSIADQVIVVYKDKAYDYSSYFEETPVYDYLDEAVEARQELEQKVMR